MLMSHAPQVAIPSTTLTAVIDQEGNRHRLIEVMSISICRPTAPDKLQEGVAHLDLVVMPSETLMTL